MKDESNEKESERERFIRKLGQRIGFKLHGIWAIVTESHESITSRASPIKETMAWSKQVSIRSQAKVAMMRQVLNNCH